MWMIGVRRLCGVSWSSIQRTLVHNESRIVVDLVVGRCNVKLEYQKRDKKVKGKGNMLINNDFRVGKRGGQVSVDVEVSENRAYEIFRYEMAHWAFCNVIHCF
ncbi:hypothetical protein P280DRAFT_76801 [Massarina eburnea CBS 473.64]|uniref:Uncharacterized protein n=1 Tax=Massarina eburnea CBS 473.64 TaxID=1395130 RepID=A0A6A6RUL2_9PLEO|nr:hypothetical protein P280DRAFT_76801 [Massarina eburnea CBS 473.64]